MRLSELNDGGLVVSKPSFTVCRCFHFPDLSLFGSQSTRVQVADRLLSMDVSVSVYVEVE